VQFRTRRKYIVEFFIVKIFKPEYQVKVGYGGGLVEFQCKQQQ